jgi:hypothetical protein
VGHLFDVIEHPILSRATMKLKPLFPLASFALLATAQFISPLRLHAQAPPGPLPAAQPKDDERAPNTEQPRELKPATKESLKGSWKLNIDDSDDAHKKMEAASTSQNNGPYGGNRGGGMGGGSPWPGGGGMGGSRGGMGRNQGEDTTPQVQRLLDPPDSLSFTQKPGEVDVIDSRSRKIAFYTDGRKIEKSKDNEFQELDARWQDVELVSDEKIQNNRKITREYEIEPGGQRLYETLRIDLRNGSRLNIRYAYDIIPDEKP